MFNTNSRIQGYYFLIWVIFIGLIPCLAENIVFPDDAIKNVKQAPYNAKGDGVTDDTEALNMAFSSPGLFYFPNGTYLVSNTLKWTSSKRARYIMQGQSVDGTIIKLKASSSGFNDTAQNKFLLYTATAPEQRFRNGIRNMTFVVGKDNPRAVGVGFYASNQGGMHHVKIISEDKSGAIGLDLGYSSNNGPLLINDVMVDGFNIGIRARAGHAVTMENIQVKNQSIVGFSSEGNVYLRKFNSVNSVTAIRATKSHNVLIDAIFESKGETKLPAMIHSSGDLFVRNLESKGYGQALKSEVKDTPTATKITEWASADPVSLFANSSSSSLQLPIKETPIVPWDPLNQWESIGNYPPRNLAVPCGTNSRTVVDYSQSFQKAIDAGKSTVYWPHNIGSINQSGIYDTVYIRGNVRRIIGSEYSLSGTYCDGDFGKAVFVVEEGSAPVVTIERWDNMYTKWTIINRSKRTVVVSSSLTQTIIGEDNTGDLFIEDVSNVFLNIGKNVQVWARQHNQERSCEDMNQPLLSCKADNLYNSDGCCRPNTVNNGGRFWQFGLKTEQNRTKVWTSNGGKTETYGYILANRSSNPLPMFVVENSDFSASISEDIIRNAPFDTVLLETRNKQTKALTSNGKNAHLPLLTAFDGATLRLNSNQSMVRFQNQNQVNFFSFDMMNDKTPTFKSGRSQAIDLPYPMYDYLINGKGIPSPSRLK